MKFIERIANWLGLVTVQNASSETNLMRVSLEAGRQAKRAEDYEQALARLNTAAQQAKLINDPLAAAVINLHRAEVLTAQRKWDEADAVLRESQQDAFKNNYTTQMAYVLCARGILAQAQEKWQEAREYYEQALARAREANAEGAEGRVMGHLADTYLHDNNASYAVHLLRDALPKLNTSGDIELTSYFFGRLGEALIETGQSSEGMQLLNRALRLAEQMRYRRYERRWHLALGQRAAAEGRYQDAYGHYERALQLFGSKVPLSPEYTAALCQMSKVCQSLYQREEALQWALQAYTLSENLGDSPGVMPLVEATLGSVLRGLGRNEEAIPHLEKAVEIYHEASGEASNGALIDALRNLAAAQTSVSTETAIATYRRALELAEKHGVKLEMAQTHRDLGLVYSNQYQMQAAIQEWMTALAIYEANKHPAQVARLYCDIGNARRYLGHGQRAIKDFENALMALNNVEDEETKGVVLSNAAKAYVDQGDIDSTDAFFNEAIKIAQRLEDRRAEAIRLGNYGLFLLVTGRPQRAETTLNYALRISRELGLKLQAAVQTDNLGLIQDTLGDYLKAIHLHQQALDMVQPLNDFHWEGIFRANLATTLLAIGQSDEAASIFDETLKTGRATEDMELIIRSLIGQARTALKRGQFNAEVETPISEATYLARKADMRRLLAEALVVRSEQQAALNQHAEAEMTWGEAKKLFTMLYATQTLKQPAWLDTKPISEASEKP